MTEAEWLACDDPRRMNVHLRSFATLRKARLVAFACCRVARSAPNIGTRSRRVVGLMELLADGLVTEDELRATILPPVMNFGCADGDFNLAEHFLDPDLFMAVWSAIQLGNGTAATASSKQTSSVTSSGTRSARSCSPRVAHVRRSRAGSGHLRRARLRPHADPRRRAPRRRVRQPDVLAHCRDANAVHVRGCWVVDLLLKLS
jgi:hypothetical protein